MASTLVCEVRRRLPFAEVAVVGTLDRDSMARMLVELRDCLADLPTAVVVDGEYLAIAPTAPLAPLMELAASAARWPRVRMMWCARTPAAARMFREAGGADVLEMLPGVAAAVEVATALPVPGRMSIHLAPRDGAPTEAREMVDAACARFDVPKLSKLAQLLVSELVTNAVVHARTGMTLTVRVVGRALQLVVRDQDPRPMHRPPPGSATPSAEHGRGLLVLDAMADAWGTLPTRDGKAVWAELIMPERLAS